MGKKNSMSSYQLNTASIDSPWTEEEKEELTYECPECGAEALRWVREDYELLEGKVIQELEHLRCGECGERCFDIAAMRRIEAIQSAIKPPRRTRKQTSAINNA